MQVKAAGGVRGLDGLIKVRDLGGSRCGTTAAMMDDYRKREVTGDSGESSDKNRCGRVLIKISANDPATNR